MKTTLGIRLPLGLALILMRQPVASALAGDSVLTPDKRVPASHSAPTKLWNRVVFPANVYDELAAGPNDK